MPAPTLPQNMILTFPADFKTIGSGRRASVTTAIRVVSGLDLRACIAIVNAGGSAMIRVDPFCAEARNCGAHTYPLNPMERYRAALEVFRREGLIPQEPTSLGALLRQALDRRQDGSLKDAFQEGQDLESMDQAQRAAEDLEDLREMVVRLVRTGNLDLAGSLLEVLHRFEKKS